MLSIQEKILLYSDLPEDEQAGVQQHIREHPELEALFAESQALHALLDAAREDAIPDASALLDYVLFSAITAGNPPADVAVRHARTEAAVHEHPELQAQVEAIRSSLHRLTETAEDPIARFERLTARNQGSFSTPAADREAVARRQGMRLVRPVRLALAAGLAFVAVYGVLSVMSWRLQPERARLAGLHNAADVFEEMRFRGQSAEPPPDDLVESLEILREARSSTLGLFPSYDGDRLDAAAELAERVAADVDQATLRRIQAHYVLGKIRMYQGRDAEAVEAFQTVVDHRALGAEEARRLLDFIGAQQAQE